MQFGYGTKLGKRVKILQDVPLSYWGRCAIGGKKKKKDSGFMSVLMRISVYISKVRTRIDHCYRDYR